MQIVLTAGDKKKGRAHSFGIVHLAMSSFMGNYYWYFGRKYCKGKSNLLATTENQYNKAFKKVISQL